MTKWHPWRRLRELAELEVHFAELAEGVRGTIYNEIITLAAGMNQVERRCVLTHEILHWEMGHRTRCKHRDEVLVQQATARRLITLDDLAAGLAWAHNRAELADELWVLEDVLDVRLDHLHPVERAHLHRATAHHREAI